MSLFSDRTSWPRQPNNLVGLLESKKQQGLHVFDLTRSNPTDGGFAWDEGSVLSPLSDQRNLLYDPQPFGSREARGAIARLYQDQGCVVDPEQIVLTSSSSEAYSFLFRLIFNPQDSILLPCPSYPLFGFLTDLNDIICHPYQLHYDDRVWSIDMNSMRKAIDATTKAVVVVHPNNPTGSFVKKTELAEINSVCKSREMAIICDEVFLDYLYVSDDGLTRSLASNQETLTFVIGGLSKSLGLPQMKLSWIIVAGPEHLRQEALHRLEIIADTYLSVGAPASNALARWLGLKNSRQQCIMEHLMRNREIFSKIFDPSCPVKALAIEGGWYGVIQLPGEISEEDVSLELLQRENVFVHPGYFFDFSDWPCLVVSLLTPSKDFEEGLVRIKKYF